MNPTRWGFLGAGFVASMAMGPAVHAAKDSHLEMVAARDLDRATALSPHRVSSSYDEVIGDPHVDAIYISLTNEAHEEWVAKALAAGKHVLCEKPLAVTESSAVHMIRQAKRAHLVEALWYRWHPRFERTMEIIASGLIGEITSIDSVFTFDGVPADNYRLQASRGGGAILDVGPYTLDASLKVLDAAARSTVDGIEISSRKILMSAGDDGVDLMAQAQLVCNGALINWSVSIASPAEQVFTVHGTRGSLSWTGAEAFTVWKSPCSLEMVVDGSVTHENFLACEPYQLMVEQCHEVFTAHAEPFMSHADSIRLAHVLDQVIAN